MVDFSFGGPVSRDLAASRVDLLAATSNLEKRGGANPRSGVAFIVDLRATGLNSKNRGGTGSHTPYYPQNTPKSIQI
jgi:hypothetical protein